MSSSSVKLAIIPAAGPISACKPILMPFHINYNGPAAVSAFMHVEKLVAVANADTQGSELQVQTDNGPEGPGKCPTTASEISGETPGLQATTSSDTVDDSPTLTRSTTESTLVTETSSTTLEGSSPDLAASSSSSSFPQPPTKSQSLAPPIEDLDDRFVSTFRGRTIHGLTINLPDGYAGVVLRSKSDQVDEADGKATSGTGRGDAQRTRDVDVDVEMESRPRRRRGRLISSAAPRKGTVIDISDDNPPAQGSNSSTVDEPDLNDIEMAESHSPPNEFDGPLRTLVPTARFDSFTLWQADRMVNKSNDEYWRALTEWIGLAHEIHAVDD